MKVLSIVFSIAICLIITTAHALQQQQQQPSKTPAALFIEFENCLFTTEKYQVEQQKIISLKWIIPVEIFQEIDFHVCLTDVITEEIYDHQQIDPKISKHLFKGVYIGHLHFVAPPKNTLIRFDFRGSLSTIDSPFAKIGNIIVGDYQFNNKHSNNNNADDKSSTRRRTSSMMMGEEQITINDKNNNNENVNDNAIIKINCLEEYQFNITNEERINGKLDPMKKYQAEKVLEECGMIHLHHLFDDDIIQEVKQSIMSYLCTYQNKSRITLAKSCSTTTTTTTTTTTNGKNNILLPTWNKTFVPIMSINAEKRFEFVTPFEKPFSNHNIYANPILLQLLNNVLAPEYVLESLGGFNAMPGATDQKWHIDNEHVLFHKFPKHPPYCSTFSVPLVPCNEITGCTEFSFKSHHCLDASHTGTRIDGTCPETVNVWPKAMPGDAIIHDPRIMHRGRANVGKIDRPMLHNSYCHIWYKDEDNQRGDGIYMKNLQKLGRIPLHIVKDLNEYNMDVVEKLRIRSLVEKMYTIYRWDDNEQESPRRLLPVTEAFYGTSTSDEIINLEKEMMFN